MSRGALLLWPLVLLVALLLRLLRGPLPPGLEAPGRLRVLEAASLLLFSLAWLGSKLGLGSQVQLMGRLREAALCALTVTPDPAVSARDDRIDGVAVRVYTPRPVAQSPGETPGETPARRPTIIFYHGGGWMFGSVDSYDHLTRFLVKHTGAELISVEYRLAPEHRFPAPLEDCARVARGVLGGAAVGPVALCGDSAGGNLAVAVALTLARDAHAAPRPLPQPVALALLYPSLQMIDLNLPSHAQSDAVPVLSRASTAAYCLAYMGAPLNLVPAMLKGEHSSPRHRAALRALAQEEASAPARGVAGRGEPGATTRRRRRTRSPPGGAGPSARGAAGRAGGEATRPRVDGGGTDVFGSGVGSGGYGVYDDGGRTAAADATPSGPAGLAEVARACLDPLLCPLAAGDAWLSLLPRRLLLLSCEHDVLRDEARALAARARRCGLRVERRHVAGGFHGVLGFYGGDGRAGVRTADVRGDATDGDESPDRAARDDDDRDGGDGAGGGGATSAPCRLCAWFWLTPVCWLCARPVVAFRCGEEALADTAAFLRRCLAAAVRADGSE